MQLSAVLVSFFFILLIENATGCPQKIVHSIHEASKYPILALHYAQFFLGHLVYLFIFALLKYSHFFFINLKAILQHDIRMRGKGLIKF